MSCTVCDDEDDCPFTSVQAAIDAAAAGDTIFVCEGTYKETISITKDLTLTGVGDDVELDGDERGVVVSVPDGVTAVIQGMTIANGQDNGVPDSPGGGIITAGDLTLTNAIVEKNTGGFGGGIANGSNGRLTLNNTTVRNNGATSDDANPDEVGGGGIWNAGELRVGNGSVLSGNEAFNGGAIVNVGVATIDGGSRIEKNQASNDGGGIHNSFTGQVTIDGSTVRNNTAAGNGGGILNIARKGGPTLTIRNTAEIGENTARSGGGVYNQSTDDGGAATMTINDSAITDNEADDLGGGIFNGGGTVHVQSSTVFDNDANDTGGGIFNTEGGVVTLDAQSAVVDNKPNNCVGTDACGT